MDSLKPVAARSRLLARRTFLRYLAASPALATGRVLAQGLSDLYAPQPVESADAAVNVFDFHEVAKRVLSPAHYTYLALGTDDGGTVRANREGFGNYHLRVRRLVDVRNVDTSLELFGEQLPLPILLAPAAAQGAFHEDGELATARASAGRNVPMMLSTVASTTVEDVNEARGRPAWFQLYTSLEWQDNLRRVRRAEAAGCPVLVLTVDLSATNREAMERFRRDSNPECQACHGAGGLLTPGGPIVGPEGLFLQHLDWDFVDRLKDATDMRLLLKGIVTAEDAVLAMEHGVDGIIVSNHGGRAEDSGRSTIGALPEVVDAVAGRMPVIVDGAHGLAHQKPRGRRASAERKEASCSPFIG